MADARNKPISRVLNIADPAVAVGFSITPSTAASWLIRNMRFQLVTDANVAARAVFFTQTDNTREYFRSSASSTQAASLTVVYGGFPGSQSTTTVGQTGGLRFNQEGLWLPVGHTLTFSVENVQAGDQISGIGAYIYEFPLGPREFFWPFMPTLLEESS